MVSQVIENEGIVLDIDETLSNTIGYLVVGLQEKFGNPENLSPPGIIEKYRYTWKVPYWQSAEALSWVKDVCHSNDVAINLPVIDGAVDYVNKIHEIIPIVGYVTARPVCVREGTERWLAKHGFPEAPVVCRPEGILKVEMNRWKAGLLKRLYPQVMGIVDDNLGLAESLNDYGGHVFLYSRESVDDGVRGIPCIDWKTVYGEVKKTFG